MGNLPLSYALYKGSQSATWHKWTHRTLTPAKQAGTWFTYPEGWKAELT